MLTGTAGGLPDSGEPVEYASLTGSANSNADATQVASLSPNREFDLSDFSVALSGDIPANGSVAVELLTRTVAAPAETVVLGCTITAGRTCTAAGPATLPANQLFYVRITPGNNANLNRGYWGVSVEP